MVASESQEILRQFYPDGIIYQDFFELARDVSRRTYRPLSRDNQRSNYNLNVWFYMNDYVSIDAVREYIKEQEEKKGRRTKEKISLLNNSLFRSFGNVVFEFIMTFDYQKLCCGV